MGEFLLSEHGRRLTHRSRTRRRLDFAVVGHEPVTKRALSATQRTAFRAEVRQFLASRRRSAFRGPLVLRLDFKTTSATPGHIHTLAKSYLDLLGAAPAQADDRALLFSDDSQVHGLVVRCHHGSPAAEIRIAARALRDFKADLRDAADSDERPVEWDSGSHSDDLSWLSDERYEDLVEVFGASAIIELRAEREALIQRELLRSSSSAAQDLRALMRVPLLPGFEHSRSQDIVAASRARLLNTSPYRITLPELPSSPGASADYRRQAVEALRRFRQAYRLLDVPIRVPLALEVLVKPPVATHGAGVHDLDNILRRYLVPGVIETFRPPADFMTARQSFRTRSDDAPRGESALHQAPIAAAIGLIRMEAWRLPRAFDDFSPGFVSLALVADDFGYSDSISQVETAADRFNDY